MRIVVTDVSATEHPPLIDFACSIGRGCGRWASGIVRVGNQYDIEFTIDAVLNLGCNCQNSPKRQCAISVSGGDLQLVGFVEQIDSDKVATLRLTSDCLVLLETASDFDAGIWLDITLPIDRISIYAIGGSGL